MLLSASPKWNSFGNGFASQVDLRGSVQEVLTEIIFNRVNFLIGYAVELEELPRVFRLDKMLNVAPYIAELEKTRQRRS